MVALLLIHQIAATVGQTGPAFEAASQTQATIAFVVFTLPLMLFSLIAGVFSDRLSKRTVIIAMKIVEVALMGAGTLVLWSNPTGGTALLVVLGAMGIHSAILSPAKYGILPELLPYEQLSMGNGLLKLWTFVAIIAGTSSGGVLLQYTETAPWQAGLILTIVAVMGAAAAYAIPRVPPARAEGGVAATLAVAWATMRTDRLLSIAIGINVVFWTIASLFGQDMLIYAKSRLALSDALSGLPMAILAIGIGIGSVLAGRLSASKIETGLIPPGAIGLALGLFVLGLIPPSLTWTLVLMGGLGVASGFINVPINALIQWRAPADRRGAVIALGNTFVFGGILAGSLGAGLLSQLGLSATEILLACAVFSLLGFLIIVWLLPNSLLRFVVALLPRVLYRLTVIGQDHIPREGGALLVLNHVSFIDGFLLIASLDRPVRFVVDEQYADHPLFKLLMKRLNVIPTSSAGTPRTILRALRSAGHALDGGELVCIFPEGQITRTGTLLPFRRGFERIVKGRTVPIIPVHLDRVWGSIFSFNHGRFLWKVPEQLPYPVTVSFGAPLPSRYDGNTLRAKIHELGEAAWQLRKPGRRPLHRQFISAMRRYPFRMAMADQNRPRVSSLQALIGSIVLARTLRPYWQGQDYVGVLLPPTVATALVNVAAALCGKIIVNLNYTVGKSGLEAAVRLAGLRTIVTSHTFIDKAKLELPDGQSVIWLEESRDDRHRPESGRCASGPVRSLPPHRTSLRANHSAHSGQPGHDHLQQRQYRRTQGCHAFALQYRFQLPRRHADASSLSRRTGSRHLAVLSFIRVHGVLVRDVQQCGDDLSPITARCGGDRRTDPTVSPHVHRHYPDVPAALCPPLHTGTVQFRARHSHRRGKAVLTACAIHRRQVRHRTDRRLRRHGMCSCDCRQLPGLPRCRVLPTGIAPRYRRPTAPWGVTTDRGSRQLHSLPTGASGMLLVKGPNVMNGYLGREDLTTQVMRNGWYVTGDIASLDDDGFLTITDRLSRFSKIGGEMVPHGKVEEALQQAAGADSQVFAVTGLPDDKKGERLVVLHTLDESMVPDILAKLSMLGLPNLFIPSRQHFVMVETIPVLGTGKLDLRGVKRIAMERLRSGET
jgi:1-acyl-sn-glycerol-3-phosphate acyltransferase